MALSKLHRRYVKYAVFVLIAVALCIFVPLTSIIALHSGDNQQQKAVTNIENATDATGALLTLMNVTSFNSISGVCNVHFIFSHAADPIPFRVLANSKLTNFSAVDFLPQLDAAFTVVAGSSNRYPFDSYEVYGTVLLLNVPQNESRPMAMYLAPSIDSWNVEATLSNLGGDNPLSKNLVEVTLTFQRNVIAIIFAVFISLLMWLLALSAFILATGIWVRARRVEPPTIAVVGSLLFALPAMRNVQPGSPQVGCVSDVAAFFWALLLVAISMVMLLWNYITLYKKDAKPPAVKVEKEQVQTVL